MDVKGMADGAVCELLGQCEIEEDDMTEFLVELLECVTFQLKIHLEACKAEE